MITDKDEISMNSSPIKGIQKNLCYTLCMQSTNEILVHVVTIFLGLCGFLVAKHIYDHKKANKPLVCPIGFDCNFVTHSDYSEFMHIPLEVFGMIYYAFLSVSYIYFILSPSALTSLISFLLLIMSFGAFLFSLYLVGVQIFILKKGCSWCLVSFLISTLVFVITALNYDLNFIAQIFVK